MRFTIGHGPARLTGARLAVIAVALPLLLAAVRQPEPAAAFEVWCADDPVISVEGRLIDIQVQLPVKHLLTMRSTRLNVIIPQNTTGAVVLDDVSAFPMHTVISPTGPRWDGRGPLPITVVAEVQSATNHPIRLAVRSARLSSLLVPTTAEGTANVPLRLPFSVE